MKSSYDEKVEEYYDVCEGDYRFLWHLDSEMAMHYGFWLPGVRRVRTALAKENQVLAEIAKVSENDYVLDAGCGVGGSAIYLAKNFGSKVTGITLSESQVEKSKKNAERENVGHLVTFSKQNFSSTSFEDGTFDVVWAVESVCYSENKKDFIEEAYRILKPGGRIIVADFFQTRTNLNDIEKEILRKVTNGWCIDSFDTRNDFEKTLIDTNFKNVKNRNVTDWIRPSSRRLYLYSFPGLVITYVANLLHLRDKTQTGNVVNAHYQYKALKNGLWDYGILYGEK